METGKIRDDFPIFQERTELSYLDNAATTQKPAQVIEAVEKFYSQNNSNVGRGLYDLAADSTKAYSQARKNIAEFIGADADETVFVRGCTEAVNLLASSLDIEGRMALPELAHHSEQLPWRENFEEIDFIPVKDGKIDIDAAEELITQKTAVVSVPHVSNVYGTVQPVEQLVELAHENDALVVLDAAQSVPSMPVDFHELDVDFAMFSGHKMLGPTGIGVLYGKRNLLEEMTPYQVGGGMVDSVTKQEVEYKPAPEKFEAGTPNIAGAVGLSAAVDYLRQFEPEEILEHERELNRHLVKQLRTIEGIKVLSPVEATITSFTAEFAHPHDIAEVLNQNNVAVRAGNHCAQPLMEKHGINGTVRASPYIYNTEKDVRRLVRAVKEAKRVFDV
ncbi:aminotransferase class V-fold PLP-dependent enzyme [Candidatus Nanohalococcus occultus]|uniref:cysteine desulfurase n=1 Tax=Candidatus Nanohalococcus occultus TaxID=2978047 RepID=A0ABY8CI71_9ARCH|nr:Selenocysteine lyase/Cysteine desulfurase [Candidatus Nanohaloarchaeota archaeon SVXNc]